MTIETLQSEMIAAMKSGDEKEIQSAWESLHNSIAEQIKADFEELYRQMNGMPLREMDRIVYPVCKLCRDHERAGFAEGVRIGIRLFQEMS